MTIKKITAQRRGADACTAAPAAPKSTKGAGRPRALTDAQVKKVQLLYEIFMLRHVFKVLFPKIYSPKIRIPSKCVVQSIAKGFRVGERVIVDVVMRRGAYRNAGYPRVLTKSVALDLQVEEIEAKLKSDYPNWTP